MKNDARLERLIRKIVKEELAQNNTHAFSQESAHEISPDNLPDDEQAAWGFFDEPNPQSFGSQESAHRANFESPHRNSFYPTDPDCEEPIQTEELRLNQRRSKKRRRRRK